MLDTIVYIPTILAYAFITLLVVILCFIVIYVSHKIYISIYDNLPVVTSSLFSGVGSQTKGRGKRQAGPEKTPSKPLVPHTILAASKNAESSTHLYRKSKTALRIIVTLEPCYLAYVVFETLTPNREQQKQQQQERQHQQQQQRTNEFDGSNAALKLAEDPSLHEILFSQKFIRFYDRLSAIPPVQCQQSNTVAFASPTRTYRHPVLSLLDTVVQKALTPRSKSM